MTGWAIARKTIIAGAVATAAAMLTAGAALCAEPPAEKEDKPFNVLDTGHATTSERVRRLGAWLDRFFADENYEAEVNKSFLRIRLDSFSELYEGTEPDGVARLHLKLPALSERLRFEILSPGEQDDLGESNGGETAPPPPGATEENPSVSVSYIFRSLEERSIIARVGLDFNGYDPNPYAGIRYRELVALNDFWNFRFTERVRFYTLDGLESRTSLDFERILEENMLFRSSLNGTWLQEDPDYFYNVGVSLFRPLDEKSAVELQLVSDFMTDPHRLDRITVRIRHRQEFWREWLAFEIAPQVSFPDQRDFEAVPGILFRLEATFGG